MAKKSAKKAAKKTVKRAARKATGVKSAGKSHPADSMTMSELRSAVSELGVLRSLRTFISEAYHSLTGSPAPAKATAKPGRKPRKGKGGVRPKSVITRARKANPGVSDSDLLKAPTVSAWMAKNGWSAARMKQAISDNPAK